MMTKAYRTLVRQIGFCWWPKTFSRIYHNWSTRTIQRCRWNYSLSETSAHECQIDFLGTFIGDNNQQAKIMVENIYSMMVDGLKKLHESNWWYEKSNCAKIKFRLSIIHICGNTLHSGHNKKHLNFINECQYTVSIIP